MPFAASNTITARAWSATWPNQIIVGTTADTVSANTFTGYIAELAAWNYALNSTQLTELMTLAPSAISGAAPIFYAPLTSGGTATIGTNMTVVGGSGFDAGVHPTLSGGGGAVAPIVMRWRM
jgi:hypothetical protein